MEYHFLVLKNIVNREDSKTNSYFPSNDEHTKKRDGYK